MKTVSLKQELSGNSYPGRGIVIGRSADGKYAVCAYFIMGRSMNSRNRIFVEDGNGIRTQAFDPSKLSDPSLIIYAPVRVLGNKTIVTNGDQTDTIYEMMDKQSTFEQALRTREFEPDAPNYTPRISGIMHVENGTYNSDEKEYDGKPLTCDEWILSKGKISPEHTLEVDVRGEQTKAGVSDNVADVVIYDKGGMDVSDQYEIVVDAGKLEVTKKKITVQSYSSSKVYDGTEFSYRQAKLVKGRISRVCGGFYVISEQAGLHLVLL